MFTLFDLIKFLSFISNKDDLSSLVAVIVHRVSTLRSWRLKAKRKIVVFLFVFAFVVCICKQRERFIICIFCQGARMQAKKTRKENQSYLYFVFFYQDDFETLHCTDECMICLIAI